MTVTAKTAYPVQEFKILENPSEPDVALVAVRTSKEEHHFVVNRDILESLAKAFRDHAAKMPPKLGGPIV